jgi:hypothetical protein
MKTYKIDDANPVIKLIPKNAFFGQNSLLTIKISKVPYDKVSTIVNFKVTYGNATGYRWVIPVQFEPPYYFNAVTPDLRDMSSERVSPFFTSIEIEPLEKGEYIAQVDFNSNLHRNLDPFYRGGKAG